MYIRPEFLMTVKIYIAVLFLVMTPCSWGWQVAKFRSNALPLSSVHYNLNYIKELTFAVAMQENNLAAA
jgi:hypothetical protein